ncbi:MAG: TOBE domain-containing protein, partial [Clostridiales bacterium]|nr:TOBE domain-containing protein [Clostridiales bacterium]
MGVRPENIHDEEVFLNTSPDTVIDVNVEIVELMGSETYLYLKTTGKDDNIIARVDPRSTSRGGDSIRVAFDANRLHFFDKDTEATLLNR